MPDGNEWKIDRRIPIAVIITLFLQIAGALIWASELDARVSSMERQAVGMADFSEKFARLEERMEGIRHDVGTMRRQVDHLTNRLLSK